jgi:hypothetical protein
VTLYLNSEDAAGVLGLKTSIAASALLRKWGAPQQTQTPGGRNSWAAEDVVEVVRLRRLDALERHGGDPTAYAREIKNRIDPPRPEMVTLADGHRVVRDEREWFASLSRKKGAAVLPMLGPDPVMIFGVGVMEAVVKKLQPGGCRTCLARALTPWGGLGPELDAATVTLLGKPCLGCVVDLTPRKPKPRPKAAPRRSAAASRPVTASAAPVVKDSARFMLGADKARAQGDEVVARHLESRARYFRNRGQ